MSEHPQTPSGREPEQGKDPPITEDLETYREPTALLNGQGIIQSVNAAFSRRFSISPEDARGRCLFSIPGFMRAGYAVRHSSPASGTSVRMTAKPTSDPHFILVTFSRESYVRRMVREADVLVAVAENSPEFIGITDLEGKPYFLNAAGRVLVGLTDNDSVMRANIEDYFAPEDRPHAQEVVEYVIREGTWTGETTMRHFQTGEPITIYGSLFTLQDPQTGKPFALASVARDIREEKRREEEAAAANERQARIAQTLQHALLMVPAADSFSGLTFTPLYRPALDEALVGGDFYDAFAVRDGVVALIVGDATGKGLNAATYTAEIRFALRAFLREHGAPAVALTLLNDFVSENDRLDREHLGGSYVAVAVVLVDTVNRTLSCSTAGTEAPVILRAGTNQIEEVVAGGPILGVLAGAEYPEQTMALAAGDLVVIATDGITEARLPGVGTARAFFGQDGLIRSIAKGASGAGTLRDIGESILSDTLDWAGGAQHDDICLLLARVA